MVKWLRTVDLKVSSSSMFTILPGNLFRCLIDHGKKLFACRLQLERGLRNNTELPSLEVWEKGVSRVRYKSLSNYWFLVPFAVRRLNCRVPYKLVIDKIDI